VDKLLKTVFSTSLFTHLGVWAKSEKVPPGSRFQQQRAGREKGDPCNHGRREEK
jgi:hypothetical protein